MVDEENMAGTNRHAGGGAAPDGTTMVADTDLRAGALRLPAILMQSVTTIAPTFGIVLILPVVASYTGLTVPVAFAIITVILIVVAASVSQVARHLPSAGAFYTYASRAIHPRVGFMAGWLYGIAFPLGSGFLLAFFAYTMNTELTARFSVQIPWWITFIVLASFVSLVVYRGIELSAKNLVLFGGLEVVIMLALAIWSLADPGPGGFNLHPFDPGASSSTHGLYLAVVLSLFAMIGWEEAAPLAEETEDPQKNIPRAMVGSLILTGLLFVFCTWGVIVGFGTDRINSLINSPEAPAFVVAKKYWGDAGTIIVLLALLNSAVAVAIASYNGATRMMYGMGRSGAIPRWFGKTHPTLKTPVNAIYAESAITFVTALVFGLAMGVPNYFNTFALMDTLGIGLCLVIVMFAVTAYFLRERRASFRVVQHLILPGAGAAAILWVIYKSVTPLPAAPVKWAIPVVGAWIVVGLASLALRKQGRREAWQTEAGVTRQERAETPTEVAMRPAPWE